MIRLITIFTPTYNRAKFLPRLYESLKRQTRKDFVWLVVDDGSTDNTRDLINGWKEEYLIDIRYIFKENGGKMRAHNVGVKVCETELFMCLDSDDYLTDGCVDSIYRNWDGHRGNLSVSAMVAYRNMIGMKPSYFPQKDYATLQQINETYRGETALAFRTDVLKANLFPEIEGEKFVGEGVVYDKLDSMYVMAVVPEYWIECEYQEGGLTDSALRLLMNNPNGWALNAKTKYVYRAKTMKDKIKYASTYVCASLVAHRGIADIIRDFPNSMMCILSFPIGIAQMLRNKFHFKA